MPINIYNVTKGKDLKDDTADHQYEIFINNELITQFSHRRDEGLGVCLIKAGEAVIASKRPIKLPTLKTR